MSGLRNQEGLDGHRRAKRTELSIRIKVAPYDGARWPSADEFVDAVGRDISRSGISFCMREEPPSDRLLLVLGNPVVNYMSARVVHSREGYFNRNRQFLVGCEFIRREQTPCGGQR